MRSLGEEGKKKGIDHNASACPIAIAGLRRDPSRSGQRPPRPAALPVRRVEAESARRRILCPERKRGRNWLAATSAGSGPQPWRNSSGSRGSAERSRKPRWNRCSYRPWPRTATACCCPRTPRRSPPSRCRRSRATSWSSSLDSIAALRRDVKSLLEKEDFEREVIAEKGSGDRRFQRSSRPRDSRPRAPGRAVGVRSRDQFDRLDELRQEIESHSSMRCARRGVRARRPGRRPQFQSRQPQEPGSADCRATGLTKIRNAQTRGLCEFALSSVKCAQHLTPCVQSGRYVQQIQGPRTIQ